MANPDRPNGFTPVGTLSGANWQGLVRRAVMADASADSTNNHGDIYLGTPVRLDATGKALAWESGDTDCVGVCVGVGYRRANAQNESGPFDPDNLVSRFANHADSSSTTVLIDIYYAPAEDTIYEVQTDSTALTVQVTDYVDVIASDNAQAVGDRTTSKSNLEVAVPGDSEFKIVAIPEYPDNDATLANARIHGVFANTEFGAAR